MLPILVFLDSILNKNFTKAIEKNRQTDILHTPMKNSSILNPLKYISGTRNEEASQKDFLSRIFMWMGAGLGLTALVCDTIISSPSFMNLLVDAQGEISGLGYAIIFTPIVFVLVMAFGYHKLSYLSLLILFVLYSTLMGASLSFVFLIYTAQSIYATFFTAAIMYAGMGLIGYYTKADLGQFGNILLMGFFGIILAAFVNSFLHNDGLSYIISIISVIIFCGLTAYDIQKLKSLSENSEIDTEEKKKLGILGALTLYLDFIFLFVSFLRIFGRGKQTGL